MAKASFSIPDYVVFSIMMAVSAGIGIWYGCGPGGRQKTTEEYLLANRQMRVWPVAVSLSVSFFSAITLLGVPAEIYTYGVQYCMIALSTFITFTVVAIVFLPMFRRGKVTCVNEYLEKRFSVGVRMVGCVFLIVTYMLYLFVVLYAPSLALEAGKFVSMMLYLFVVLYAPSLALEAVAGLPLYVSILTTGIVCTFYTTLGGLKAVIWTDVFQAVIMVVGLIIIAIVGSIEVGGISEVWRINDRFGRLNLFDFNPDPTVRNTFWTLTIGGSFALLPSWSVSQVAVQRYLAMKTIKDAQRALWMNIPGYIFVIMLCSLDGLVIFAVYSECNLKTEGLVSSNDQVLPYFVVHKLGYMKGVPGMFTASLYAGALSTASSALNALALMVLEDIIRKKVREISDEDAAKICKITVLVLGAVVIGGAFIVKYLGAMVLQLSFSIFGIIGGPLVGIFTLGMFVRRANYKGAYAGMFMALGMACWVFFGSVLYPPDKHVGSYSIRKCSVFNETAANITGFDGIVHNNPVIHTEPLAKFYSMSYLWLCGFSFMTTFIVGIVVSLITETEEDRKKSVDPILLFPWREWISSCLPGGRSFSWELEQDPDKVEDIDIAQREIFIKWEEETPVSGQPRVSKSEGSESAAANLQETLI